MTGKTHDRALRTALRADQRADVRLCDGCATALAPGELPAFHARKQPGASLAVEDADPATVAVDGAVERDREPIGHQADARYLVAEVHDVEQRPAVAFECTIGADRRGDECLSL